MDKHLNEEQVEHWNSAYEIESSTTLWPQMPVPFIDVVINLVRRHNFNCLLDLPCGDGKNIVPLAFNVPVVVGADTSRRALSIARRKVQLLSVPNVILFQYDIFSEELVEAQFDVVFCCDLLGHLAKAEQALRNLLRLCKPHGYLVGNLFSERDSTRSIDMQVIRDGEYMYKNKFFFKFYEEQQAVSLLQSAGATVCALSRVAWEEPPHEGYREEKHEHESWVFTVQKSR